MVEKIQTLLVLLGILLEGIIGDIENLVKKEEDPVYRESLERWRGHYQQRLALSPETNRYAISKELNLLPRLMNRTRRRLAGMRRRGLISEGVRRRIEYDFDMEEQRIRRLLSRVERE